MLQFIHSKKTTESHSLELCLFSPVNSTEMVIFYPAYYSASGDSAGGAGFSVIRKSLRLPTMILTAPPRYCTAVGVLSDPASNPSLTHVFPLFLFFLVAVLGPPFSMCLYPRFFLVHSLERTSFSLLV